MLHTYLKLLLMRITLLMLPSDNFLQLCVEFSLENYEEACIEQWVSNLAPSCFFLTKVLVPEITIAPLHTRFSNNISYQNFENNNCRMDIVIWITYQLGYKWQELLLTFLRNEFEIYILLKIRVDFSNKLLLVQWTPLYT